MEQMVKEMDQSTPDINRKFRMISVLLYMTHLMVIGALAFFFWPSPEPVVFRYNVYFGIDILSAWWQVYLIPLISIAFISVNLFLARRFFRLRQKLLSLLFFLGSVIITFGLVIAIAAIVLINS